MTSEVSPTARALATLELVQTSPGIDAVRACRIDRVREVAELAGRFTPPAALEPVALLEEHLAVGWDNDVEVVIDAPIEVLARCVPRAIGRLEMLGAETTRLVGSTSNLGWYAQQLAVIPAAYRIVRCPELRETARALAQRMLSASERPETGPTPGHRPASRDLPLEGGGPGVPCQSRS